MKSIQELMSEDHRRCDDSFVAVEQSIEAGDWERACLEFGLFREAMLRHLAIEENTIFPAFEERTGMTSGPTQFMRAEHTQLRAMMGEAECALVEQDAEAYSGTAETFLIMMQQHNMKEENVLYPLCDQHLANQLDALLSQLSDELGAVEC